MYRCHRCFCLLVVCGVLFGAAGRSAGGDSTAMDRLQDLAIGSITFHSKGPASRVHLKGRLHNMSGRRPEGEPPQITNAHVFAAGHDVILDWSQSEEARRILSDWMMPRHGVISVKQAEIWGRMVFRPAGTASRVRMPDPGITEDTLVPVVIIESIEVRLVDPGRSSFRSVISNPITEPLGGPAGP